jgi:broad specificity phosphatase PhoE
LIISTDFYIRIKDAFIELLYKYKGKKILIITYGGVITVLQCLINGWKYSNLLKITVPHAALVKLNKQ